MLLGHIYETINGTEIAIRLVDADTSEILAVGDAYDESADRSTLMFMAAKLSAKLHMDIPMMDGTIRIVNEKIITEPEKWIPFKGKIRKNWPMIVYYEQNPEDSVRGSDTTIITNASMDKTTGSGESGTMLIKTRNLEHGKIYRVITR
ncbi:MAG: hypothetical protein GY795_08745 [Desulfobacterales bacterium]|nr:hypothetical protein [Desulfobacterales bacterium]